MSSVGCPFSCDFCCMRKTGFLPRSAGLVFKEMAVAVEEHNIHEFDWFDPVMFQDKPRIVELTERLIEARGFKTGAQGAP
jgi:radical SAM superfamily enzyme YgiQ (UPF0313 family)